VSAKPKKALVHNRRLERAEFCTAYVEKFDRQNNWVELAKILTEVKENELFKDVGSETFDDWIRKHAPVSYRLCYMRSAQFKALKLHFSEDELKQFPPETAQWASKAKNISPAELKKPEVRQALSLPLQKAVAVLKEKCPDQHIETLKTMVFKFPESQYEVVKDAYEAFKSLKDERASKEDAVWCWAIEWFDSPHPDGGSFRDQWEKSK